MLEIVSENCHDSFLCFENETMIVYFINQQCCKGSCTIDTESHVVERIFLVIFPFMPFFPCFRCLEHVIAVWSQICSADVPSFYW